uniref:Uncharacterized protein n=1 Tax=Arundo donax TaxID=35708 RepID=A0A0A9AAG2_ARUDO
MIQHQFLLSLLLSLPSAEPLLKRILDPESWQYQHASMSVGCSFACKI